MVLSMPVSKSFDGRETDYLRQQKPGLKQKQQSEHRYAQNELVVSVFCWGGTQHVVGISQVFTLKSLKDVAKRTRS